MVSVAQLVESRIVIPVVVGSNPIVHPIKSIVAFRATSLEKHQVVKNQYLEIKTSNNFETFSFLSYWF